MSKKRLAKVQTTRTSSSSPEVASLKRQLEIEAALEKVRVRANAMKHSHQLKEVIQEVFNQLQGLGLKPHMCCIDIIQKGSQDLHLWVATPGSDYPKEVVIPYIEHPIFNEYHKARKNRKAFYSANYSKEDKDSFFDFAFAKTGLKAASKKRKDFVYQGISYTQSSAITRNLSIWMVNYYGDVFSKTDNDILKRFTRVLDQSYTRFLDLKKAEEQAREAQIEVALERIRARTMAMHKSDELAEAAELLYQELKNLGIDPWTCGYVFIEEEKDEARVWMVEPDGKLFWGLWTVPLSEEKILKERHQSWKRKEKIHRSLLRGKDNTDHHHYIVKHILLTPAETEDFLSAVPAALTFTSLHFSHGYLLVISEVTLTEEEENLILRFTLVFEQTYRRYLDLQKAEKQAREAQIETALERVRSRMLGMQKSSELEETTVVMYKQLDSLGVVPEGSGVYIAIIDKHTDSAIQWIVTDDSLIIAPGERRTPLTEHPLLIKTYEGWKRKDPLLIRDLSGRELQEFVGYFQSLPSWKEGELEAANLPDRLIWSEASFSQGTLGLIHQTPLTEETLSILVRFSKVFDLTYTRFLDLKKAEEQAREAQIEVALERVRSRSMAMQNSNELSEILGLIFKELTTLDIDLARCIIWIIDPDTETATFWLASPYEEIGTRSYFIPKFNHPYYKQYIKAWKSREALWKLEVHGKLKERWHDYLFKETELRQLPKDVIRSMRAPDKFYTINTFNKHGLICAAGTESFSDESIDIFKRFGRVFEQCYTRFEDIKQAEEQAREAQVETALERIRARALAMHSSDEILEVADVLREQMGLLGQTELATTAIHIYTQGSSTFDTWWTFIPTDARRKILSGISKIRIGTSAIAQEFIKKYQGAQNEYTIYATGKKLKDWQKELAFTTPELIKSYNQQLPTESYFHFSDFSGGALVLVSYQEPSEESKKLQKRSASVFNLAYRRFLDLKKAEAQTREAEIELALERVRARTMAMQHSKELPEVALVIWEQLDELKLEGLPGCAIHVNDDDQGTFEVWAAFPDLVDGEVKMKLHSHPHSHNQHCIWVFREWDKRYRAGETGFSVKCNTKQLNEFIDWFAPYIPMVAAEMRGLKLKKLYVNGAAFSNGIMGAPSLEPLSKETWSVFKRLAGVFDLAYRRFEDLKKAEEQAQDAQIEAALERVRARAMAMHSSEELYEVALVLREEMGLIGQNELEGIAIHLYPENSDTFESWFAMRPPGKKGGKLIHGVINFSRDSTEVAREAIKAFKSKNGSYTLAARGTKLKEWLGEVAKRAPEAIKNFQGDLPEQHYYQYADFSGGSLLMVSHTEPIQETKDLQQRAAAVFDLAYRRFLDLKKAEEQAREAEIELALERVRARTMAMQHSSELSEVALVLWEQLSNMKLKGLPGCAIHVNDDEKGTFNVWGAFPDSDDGSQKMKLVSATHDQDCNWVFREWYKNYRAGKTTFTATCNRAQLNEFIDWFEPYLPFLAREMRTLKLKKLYVNGVAFSNGILGGHSDEPLSEETWSVFKRLTGVFDMAYRRFEDLKKAEEQTREAQIEAALERVRARAMAMHTSEELYEVALVLREQMGLLGQPDLEASVVHLYPEGSEAFESWFAMRPPGKDKGKVVQGTAKFRYEDSQVGKECLKAFKSKAKEYTLVARGEKLKEWLGQMAQKAPQVIKYFKGEPPEQHIYHFSDFSGGSLLMVTYTEPTEQSKILQRRAAAVFDLAYKRFLDLKKAEEQAREAQIEAALERIRNRTLLMRDSGELNEAVAVFFQQFQELDLLPDEARTYFCHLNSETDMAEVWMTRADGTVMPGSHFTPLTKSASMKQFYEAWKVGKPIMERNYTGKALNDYLAFVSSLPHVKKDRDYQKVFRSPPKRIVMTDANFLQGNIGIMTFEPLNQEAVEVLKRFAKVFEFTYTRFLDLKKAERQAREEQIEIALERIRAGTMAMQDSEKMLEVGALLYQELSKLGITSMTAGITLIGEDEKIDWNYMVNPDDRSMMKEPIGLPRDETKVMCSLTASWEKQEPYLLVALNEKETITHQTYIAENSINFHITAQELISLSPVRLTLQTFNFKYGYLLLVGGDKLSKDQIDITIRFAKVFEQTYTRYLDLQKAEEQVREAQVEASLERVRAKALAMHSSEDLTETVGQLFLELDLLDINVLRCGVGRIHKDTRVVDLHTFTRTKKGKLVPVLGTAILKGHPALEGGYRGWLKQEEYHAVLKGASLKKYYQVIKPNFKLPVNQSGQVQYGYYLPFSAGCLYTFSETSLTEEELSIFRKFTSVMGLTYRRYLDLTEAEEQAREAQIEVALERIRARAMAMHSSDELMEVADVMREQMSLLGQPKLQTAAVHLYPEEGDVFESWLSLNPKDNSEDIITETVTFKKDETKLAREMLAHYRSGAKEYTMHVRGKPFEEWRQMAKESNPTLLEYWGDDVPEEMYWHFTDFSGGSFVMVSREPPTNDSKALQSRVSAAFDLAYRRFRDLQKAEEQAREAQIEAALERVRSAAMAMHNSVDIGDATAVMFRELKSLNIEILRTGISIIDEKQKTIELWMSKISEQNNIVQVMGKIPARANQPFSSYLAAWEKAEKVWSYLLTGAQLRQYYKSLAEYSFFPGKERNFNKKEYMGGFFFSDGGINTVTLEPLSEEAISILQRFAGVFDLTYRRFLDLKKAEEQAHEAQIEAALERVRAAAMAMHASDDLFDVAEVLHDQLAELGQKELESSIIHIYPDDLPTFDAWYAYRSIEDSTKRVSDRAIIQKNACSWTKAVMAGYKSGKESYLIESRDKMLLDWYHVLEEVAPDTVDYDKKGKIIVPEVLYYHLSKFSGGALLMISNEPPAEEAVDMQQRAAVVFDLAYTRFLDLKKTEAQAREAQIEASLERVRANAMAMHSSEDVGKATNVLFQELASLGIETLRCGVSIIDENQTMEVWAASNFAGDTVFNVAGIVDMTIHPLHEQLFKNWKSGKKVFTYELKGRDAERYYEAIQNLPNYEVPDRSSLPDRHISTGFLFREGALFAFTKDYFTAEATEIFQRFTNVFALTYRRYLDLKEAEARAKEAILKSSLDRVRAEIASMRNTEDLERITPLVWRELRSLGVPFFRCGVFIMDESAEIVHMYLSKPTGESLAAVHLNFDDQEIPLVQDAIAHWKTQTVHRTHWNQQQFRRFTESLKNRGLIKSLKTYQQGEKPPENLHLHQVPFRQGMLYVGNSDPLQDDQIELVQSLANAFSVAYSRYEDFVQLEEAKKSVEQTLTELKSAQDQLIHSEKMASLGELTAGIAHEIQNPLNFVNNFSEVSGELLDEMKEEIENGNNEEVAELVEDLIQNLDKIAHHGKRASGIVKGMLDHSRASSDEKVPTDINVLADEYLRLAYHGFRAKDKSFNANFNADLADDLPKINIVSQDIGRVILNLVNNAFQAVKDVENPEVVVATRHGAKGIEVMVKDNGPGIPEEIKEKIFQPFFTTKAAGEGTGLGLSLSYDIVTKGHGGEIMVKSNKKEGTEFTILLPVDSTS